MQQHPVDKSAGMEILRLVLGGLGVLLMVGGGVVAIIALARTNGSLDQAVLRAAIELGAAVFMGAALFGLAGVVWLLDERVRQGRMQQRTLEHLQAAIAELQRAAPAVPQEGAGAASAPATAAKGEANGSKHQLAQLIAEWRDLALMDDAQRHEAARRHWASRKDALVKTIERCTNKGDWAGAQAAVEDLEALLPGDADAKSWQQKIGAERAARMKGDLAAAENQLRHSMSISAWEQAEEIVAGLQRKYPDTPEVLEMSSRVQRERTAFEQENVDRMFLDLTDATEHRQWKRALQIAEEIMRRYPHEPRVERLEIDAATIRDNAASQDRKEQEELFKDLIKRQRYEEAVAVARGVMDKYPSSPSAGELMRLVPKVEELIRQERAKREKTNAGGGI